MTVAATEGAAQAKLPAKSVSTVTAFAAMMARVEAEIDLERLAGK